MNKLAIVFAIAALAAMFAAGRYSVNPPATEKVEDSVANTTMDVDKDTHRETTTIVEQGPGCRIRTITRTIEDTDTKRHVDENVVSHTDETVTPQKRNTINVSALAGIDINQKSTVYGASLTKEIIGPLTIGAYGLTNGTIGVSFGINF